VRRFAEEWLGRGLNDWCISRDAPYFGFEIPDCPGKFFYVWADAPVGYISSTEKWATDTGQPERAGALWRRGGEDPEIVHVIGKDIIYFHVLFWPVMLHAAGLELPDRVQVHGMLTLNREKMSKTRGTFILAKTFRDHLDPTYLRWYFGSKLGPGIDDIDFSTEEFVQRVNAELVNNLANLVSRGTNFLHGKLGGRYGVLSDPEKVIARIRMAVSAARSSYAQWDSAAALRAALDLSNEGNVLFQTKQPWKLIKEDEEAAREVVTYALNLARAAAILVAPVVPQISQRLLRALGSPKDAPTFEDALELELIQGAIQAPERIIDRMDAKVMQTIIDAGRPAGAPPEPNAHGKKKSKKKSEPDQISIDDFAKVQLKVGIVVEASRVEGADKLLELKVDIAEERPRNVFAGIAQAYTPEQLVGRRVAVVANLAPRKMRFGVSEGMVLAAGPGGADIQLLSVDDGAPAGSEIK